MQKRKRSSIIPVFVLRACARALRGAEQAQILLSKQEVANVTGDMRAYSLTRGPFAQPGSGTCASTTHCKLQEGGALPCSLSGLPQHLHVGARDTRNTVLMNSMALAQAGEAPLLTL